MTERAQIQGKILGFREWKFESGQLRSLAMGNYGWGLNAQRAYCRKCRQGPTEKCECGFYAWHDVSRLKEGSGIHGAILGWGRTVAHADGFRSQFAQIVALAYNDDISMGDHRWLAQVAQDAGVPFCETHLLAATAAEYGDVLAEEHRPEKASKFGNFGLQTIDRSPIQVTVDGKPLMIREIQAEQDYPGNALTYTVKAVAA